MVDRRPELAELLIRKTAEGAIVWQRNIDENSVVAVFGRGRVSASRIENERTIDILITIYDSEGEVVESFTDVDLNGLTGRETWYPQLDKMLDDAVRLSTGADAILIDIINELKGDLPI